jgi:hypothetical protein
MGSQTQIRKICPIEAEDIPWFVEPTYVKRFTQEEIIKKFKKFKEAGLIQLTPVWVGSTQVICNCCKCFCLYIHMARFMRRV